MKPIFFASPAKFRAWLEANHASKTEVLIGFHKKATGRPTLTWSESVEQALCYGWIDGVRRSAGPDSYTIRFTPRKASSIWSNINVAKMKELTALGLVRPAGRDAFQRRAPDKTGVYSFEAEPQTLPQNFEAKLRANEKAWAWFKIQPPGYRKTATHWVMGAKKEDTRRSRLEALIADSAAGRKIKPLRRPGE